MSLAVYSLILRTYIVTLPATTRKRSQPSHE